MSWSEVPWLQRNSPTASLVRLCERILQSDDLAAIIVDIAAEFGVSNCLLAVRSGDWKIVAARGDWDGPLPSSQLDSCIDREAAVYQRGRPTGGTILTPTGSRDQHMLLLSGARLAADQLADALAIARVLGRRLDQLGVLHAAHRQVDRLKATMKLARKFAGETETQRLLEHIATDAARLLGSDRASIFIWDREQRQLVACPALGVEGGRLFLPDNKGLVGDVIHSRKPVIVDDVYADPRFDQGVDKKSGYKTRNLLCVPLFDANDECLGAFELINKRSGDFSAEDLGALEDFAIAVATAVTNTRELENLVRNNSQLSEQMKRRSNIIGESPAMAALRGTIDRLAMTDLPVLILGESGTGKEVAATALHHQGSRAQRPFVAVNCAALTETLLESELFGHEKGAFTDAHAMHIGKFELAEGGTLFLDEIGDMTLGGQAKLLRVLEQKVITRVGGTQPIPVNVRVVAATNAHLAEMVREKKFRQDLYFRLSVVTLEIPPLRDRPEDILPLSKFFLERFCRDANRKLLTFSPDAEKRLQMHQWPGNVRELRNLMERIAFLAQGARVEVDDLAFILSPKRSDFDDLADGVGLMEATSSFQSEYIKRAVKRMQGNMSDAAEFLGLHRSNLYRKMRQLGMEVDDVKP
ncbi:Nif-specific regulatory protein [Planctomicrobium piriforme]|uniref:Nif-specific regulatory protein n=2 Tax=Planctomicrobium piriforme TaxID=1576369 RepID=A0A1I3RJ54_9PLAN|nr:Nif-specific regulatory protein [Planctomicrobium piriforme]